MVNEALYLKDEKEWQSVDGDPEKSFCSKTHIHIHWCISSSFKMMIIVEILSDEN